MLFGAQHWAKNTDLFQVKKRYFENHTEPHAMSHETMPLRWKMPSKFAVETVRFSENYNW